MDVEYDGASARHPTPKTVRLKDHDGERYRCDIEEARSGEVPIEEFSMVRYGLPELSPSPPPSRGNSWPLWAGAATAGLFIAWLLRRFSRRLH